MLTESLLLATAGGALGLALGYALIRLSPRLIPPGALPAGIGLSLDARVVLFTAFATLGCGILFGLAPAWQVARGTLAAGMRASGRASTTGNTRLLSIIAMAEIAIAVIVVTGAGLFLRTFDRLSQVDPGYRAERVLTASVILPLPRYPTTGPRSPSTRPRGADFRRPSRRALRLLRR